MEVSKARKSYENFAFEIAEWRFDYGFHVNAEATARDPLGICWESQYVILAGPLLSRTKRRNCRAVRLTLSPAGVDPSEWNPARKGFGSVSGVRGGELIGTAFLPAASLHSFVSALGAGNVKRCYLSIRDVDRGAGTIDAFFTLDPAEEIEDGVQ